MSSASASTIMDNDAFRTIINKQRKSVTPEKSTKEIAREAVENEFQNKRRRGGGGGRRGRGDYNVDGYRSNSGGSSDEGVNGAGRQSAKDEGGDARPDELRPMLGMTKRTKLRARPFDSELTTDASAPFALAIKLALQLSSSGMECQTS